MNKEWASQCFICHAERATSPYSRKKFLKLVQLILKNHVPLKNGQDVIIGCKLYQKELIEVIIQSNRLQDKGFLIHLHNYSQTLQTVPS